VRHVRMLGLCLVAVFAVVAVAASSASASGPEWGHCVAQKKGKYSDSNCTTLDVVKGKNKGSHEWVGGAGAACYGQKKGHYKDSACTEEDFTVKGGVKTYKGKYEKTGRGKFEGNAGAGSLFGEVYDCENVKGELIGPVPKADCDNYFGIGILISCEHEHATGEAIGADEVTNVSVRFTGCKFFTAPATTPGLEPGEVQVNPLKGRLGYINKSAMPEPEVGVLLEPKATGTLFAEIELGGAIITVGEGSVSQGSFYEQSSPGVPTGNDGIISPIVPVNKMTPTFTQKYTVNSSDYENEPSHFEGGPIELLELIQTGPEPEFSSDWGRAGEETENVNTLSEGEAEIKA
jgi:hypothetical protein